MACPVSPGRQAWVSSSPDLYWLVLSAFGFVLLPRALLSPQPEMFQICHYRPKRKLREGYVFTCVCDSVHRGRCLPQCMLRYTPSPGADTPLWSDNPPLGRQPPLWADNPPLGRHFLSRHPRIDTPLRSACWEIQATSGRYKSYWKAYLLKLCVTVIIARET